MTDGMTTEELMALALEMAGLDEVPADSAIYVPGRAIKRILFGIDLGPAELMLAHQLGYDAAVAHHPTGCGPGSWRVYLRHAEQMTAWGVPADEARRVAEEGAERLRRAAVARNYDHEPSVARLLGLPYMNIHCPLDEIGRQRIQGEIDRFLAADPSASLAALIAHLKEMPEYRAAATEPEVVVGRAEARAGRTVLSHAALTNGGSAVAQAYFAHGVDTVAYIHLGEADLMRLRAEGRGQVLVLGHIASDAVGINPFLDALEARGLEVARISGVIR
jgi:putative NIF3 family GTP cyclohydrolase 1 type 2